MKKAARKPSPAAQVRGGSGCNKCIRFFISGHELFQRAMRNLRRYIQKAEKVVLNVARWQFPSEY